MVKLNTFVMQFQWFCSIHWIPTEFYSNFDFARGSVAADVWAFGTTLWEIFAYGECPHETSNVDSIKKVTLRNFYFLKLFSCIFISWSCSHVFLFLEVVLMYFSIIWNHVLNIPVLRFHFFFFFFVRFLGHHGDKCG